MAAIMVYKSFECYADMLDQNLNKLVVEGWEIFSIVLALQADPRTGSSARVLVVIRKSTK